MKISVITPSFCQGQYIRQNIESVLIQGWASCEHIVIDGGSNDDTVPILTSYPHLRWVSERDDGQADALNKGLRLATGDIIGWINSDDYYVAGAFQAVSEAFSDPSVKWVIGDISLLDEASSTMIPLRSPDVSWGSLQKDPDIVRQQGVFIRREFLLETGGWNKEFYMVMDFDLWVRLAKRSVPHMLNRQLAVFRIQKDQKSGLANLHRQTAELTKILQREGASSTSVIVLRLKKEWIWVKGQLKVLLIGLRLLDRRYLHKPVRGWRND